MFILKLIIGIVEFGGLALLLTVMIKAINSCFKVVEDVMDQHNPNK